MEPFAADAEVVRAVAATLDNYAILPTSPEERERQRTTGLTKDYDIVGFWYCVALLVLSAEPEAVRYLLVLARMLMVEDPAELYLLRRTVRLLDGFPFPHMQELKNRIEAFYATVTHRLEAFRWLEAAGIPWPESYEWEVIAQFSSDGEPYADPAAPKAFSYTHLVGLGEAAAGGPRRAGGTPDGTDALLCDGGTAAPQRADRPRREELGRPTGL